MPNSIRSRYAYGFALVVAPAQTVILPWYLFQRVRMRRPQFLNGIKAFEAVVKPAARRKDPRHAG